MKTTVVPNRNMILLSLAAGHAISIKFDTVAYAAHAGDHTIYPDCRPEFADSMAHALTLADWNCINLLRPFVNWSKADLVKHGMQMGVLLKNMVLLRRVNSIAGNVEHVWKEKEAFELVGLSDPTQYKV